MFSFDRCRKVSLGSFKISGAIRDDAQIGVGSYFILLKTQGLLECIACAVRIATVKRSQTFINELLGLLSLRRDMCEEETRNQQKSSRDSVYCSAHFGR